MTFLPSLTIPQPTGQSTRWEEYPIADFSGGLCTAFPESNIRENQQTSLTNYYIEDNHSLKVRGPYRPYLVATQESILTAAPLSFRWVKRGTSDYLLSYRTGALEYWTGTAWQDIVEATALTGSYAQFIKFVVNDKEDVIICDGAGTPQRWIGSATSTDLGLTAPSESGVTATDGGSGSRGVGTTGVYYYKLTYWYKSTTNTQHGESNPSGIITSGTITVTAGEYNSIDLASLPTPSGNTSRVYIYRSPAGNQSGPYRRVGFITTGTTFTDDIPEGEEDVQLPIDTGTAPKLKNAVFFKGRLWGVDGDVKNKGIYSAPNCADLFPALNHIYFPDNLIGPIPFKENLYWFTEKETYVTPNGDIDTYPEPLKICNKGATSYRSIIDVGNGLVFQGEDNIYWVDFNTHSLKDGDFPIAIGEAIKDKIEDIPVNSRANTVACLHRDKYIICFTSSSSTSNDTTFAWSVKPGTRQLHKGLSGGWNYLDWKANDVQDFEGLLYSADAGNKYIMEHDFAAAAGVDYYNKTEYDATTSHSIATKFATGRLHLGHEWSEKIISSLSVATETSGITYTATFDFDNNSFQKSTDLALGTSTAVSGEAAARYGTAIYGTSTYAANPFRLRSTHKKIPTGSKTKNILLSLDSANSQDTALFLVKIYYKILPQPA